MRTKEAGLNHRTYLSTTRNFEEFSPLRLWFNHVRAAKKGVLKEGVNSSLGNISRRMWYNPTLPLGRQVLGVTEWKIFNKINISPC